MAAQPPDIQRTDLQHDLSVPGRQVVQAGVDGSGNAAELGI